MTPGTTALPAARTVPPMVDRRRDPKRLAATIERAEAHIEALRRCESIEARARVRLLEVMVRRARADLRALIRDAPTL